MEVNPPVRWVVWGRAVLPSPNHAYVQLPHCRAGKSGYGRLRPRGLTIRGRCPDQSTPQPNRTNGDHALAGQATGHRRGRRRGVVVPGDPRRGRSVPVL